MPSDALTVWRQSRAAKLDELEAAHEAVGGVGRGRRYATQQLNQAYAVLLSSQFQGFCRDLHTETADCLVAGIEPAGLRPALRSAFTSNRSLDRGNPHPGTVGSDFNRFGVRFWDAVHDRDRRNAARRRKLEALNRWRDAIAHQDFDPENLGGRTTLTLAVVRRWRSACRTLADSFDRVMRAYIQNVHGTTPW